MKRLVLALTLLSLFVGMSMVTHAAPKVTFMVLASPNLLDAPLQTALAGFTQKYGIEVEITAATNWVELQEKYATMSATGLAPDVVWGDSARLFYFANNDLLLPLNSLVAKSGIDVNRWLLMS